ncbi:MAG: hypothetical protein GWP66_07755 [Gammaproteobacteria bacterium]|jgi:uncharacterized membrane protein|nr:hypothetical protein [Gammaproteobacteria bacterium]
MEHRRAPSYPVDEPARKRAKIPHEVFLTNLVGNHILVFVATLGMASHMILPVMSVPVISVLCLGYTLWRARRAKRRDDWYVMCHWQAAARFSWIFIGMLALLAFSATVAWFGYDSFGIRKEAALALVGGIGLLPTMVTMLILIIIESDLLHQAAHGRLPKWVVRRYPPPEGMGLQEHPAG